MRKNEEMDQQNPSFSGNPAGVFDTSPYPPNVAFAAGRGFHIYSPSLSEPYTHPHNPQNSHEGYVHQNNVPYQPTATHNYAFNSFYQSQMYGGGLSATGTVGTIANSSPPLLPGPMPSTPSASSSSSTYNEHSFNEPSPHTPSPNQNGNMVDHRSPDYFTCFSNQRHSEYSDIESAHNNSNSEVDEMSHLGAAGLPEPVRSPSRLMQLRPSMPELQRRMMLAPYQTPPNEPITESQYGEIQKIRHISFKDSQDEEQTCDQTGVISSAPREQGAMATRDGRENASWRTGKTRTRDKYRVVYSDRQRLELEKEFHYSRYITIRRKTELAQILLLSERQVKIWFQNRRAKERKLTKKNKDEVGHHQGQGGQQPPQQPFMHITQQGMIPSHLENMQYMRYGDHALSPVNMHHAHNPHLHLPHQPIPVEYNIPHYASQPGNPNPNPNNGEVVRSPSNSSAMDIKPDLN